jgi:hypothetical protein
MSEVIQRRRKERSMRTTELQKLPTGTWLEARVSHEPETVELLGVRPPTEDELSFGHTLNRVEIRRFLTGGWYDTWVYPRDVIGVTEPDARTLAVINYVREHVGEKKRSG